MQKHSLTYLDEDIPWGQVVVHQLPLHNRTIGPGSLLPEIMFDRPEVEYVARFHHC